MKFERERPSVFEVSVSSEELPAALEQINEVRLTKEFLADCQAVSESLKRD